MLILSSVSLAQLVWAWHPMRWCPPPHSGRVISAQVIVPGITLTDMAKGGPHRCPSSIINPGKLTTVIGYDSYKMNLDNHCD